MRTVLDIPGIAGTVTLSGFANQIECRSMHVERRVRDAKDGTKLGKRPLDPITVTKLWDKASPALGNALVGSTVFPKATITCLNELTPPAKHLVLELSNVSVLRIAHTVNDGGTGVPLEQIVLSFTALSLTFSPPPATAKTVPIT